MHIPLIHPSFLPSFHPVTQMMTTMAMMMTITMMTIGPLISTKKTMKKKKTNWVKRTLCLSWRGWVWMVWVTLWTPMEVRQPSHSPDFIVLLTFVQLTSLSHHSHHPFFQAFVVCFSCLSSLLSLFLYQNLPYSTITYSNLTPPLLLHCNQVLMLRSM